MRFVLLLVLSGCAGSSEVLRDSNPLHENEGVDGCFDGVDNDNDHLIDCLDDDCARECDVDNLPPFDTAVQIVPADPGTTDDLTCQGTATDPEGDALTWSYTWTQNGMYAGSDATIPAAMTSGYDVWACEAVPFDGALDGTTGSAQVDIRSDNACTALAFDLTEQVVVPRFVGQDLVGTDFTLEAWAYIDSANPSTGLPILFSDPASDLSGWRLVVVGDPGMRALRLQLGGGLPTLPTVSGPIATVPEDRWVHLAVTWEGGVVRQYVDGTMVHSDTLDAPITGASVGDLTIGGTLPGGSYHLMGMLDDVRISTISRYDGDFEPRPYHEADAGTLALWHFDAGAGAVAYEEVSGHDGSVNAGWVSASPCDTL